MPSRAAAFFQDLDGLLLFLVLPPQASQFLSPLTRDGTP
jgi:hypothetical protein